MNDREKDAIVKAVILSIIAVVLVLLIFTSAVSAQNKEMLLTYYKVEHNAKFYLEEDGITYLIVDNAVNATDMAVKRFGDVYYLEEWAMTNEYGSPVAYCIVVVMNRKILIVSSGNIVSIKYVKERD